MFAQLLLAGRRYGLEQPQFIGLEENVVNAFCEADRVVGEWMIGVGGLDVQRLSQRDVGQRFLGVWRGKYN